jgi:EmrB/QacA subfamily drug resistance transporter
VKAHPDWTLVPVSLAVAMVGLDATLVAIANPYIGRDMHCSLSDLQWIVNAYLLALAVLLIPMGKIGDRFGRRLMFVVGAGGFGLSSLGVGVVGSIGGVIGFRAAQGVFGAMLMPSTLAILRSAFPPERLNRAIAIWGAAAAVSVAAGPVVGGLLVQHASWEWCFFINVPGGAVTIALGLLMLAETRGWDHAAAFDFRGLAFLGAGLFCVVFGLVKADAWGWVTTKTLGFLLVGVALVVAFGLSELRASAPLVPMRLFRSLRMTFGSLTVVFIFFGLFGVLFFVSLYLQNVHGYDPVAAGLRFLPLSGTFMVACPLGGLVNDRFGPRVAIPIGMFLVSLALAALWWLEPDSSYAHLWVPFVVLGLGIGPVVVASSDAIVTSAPVADAGIAGGIQSTALQIGGVLGTSVLGSVLTTRVGHTLFTKLTANGVPPVIAQKLEAARQFVGQGLAPKVSGASAALQHAVVAGSQASFMTGLHVATMVAAAVSFVAAFIGLLVHDPARREAETVGLVAPVGVGVA